MVLIKGDYANATTSAVAAFPLIGSLIGSGIKWGAKGVANAEKIADGIKTGSRIIGNAEALIQSGGQALESVGNLYDSYVKDGEIISWKNATDLITLGLSVAGMGMAGKSLAKDGKALKAVSQGNVNVKPAAVSNSTGSSGADLQKLGNKSGSDTISTQLSRRELAEKKLADAATGSRAEGVLIGKDGDVPVYKSQQQLRKSIMDAGAQYIGPTRNNDGQIYHMNTLYGPVEIRIMQQKSGQTNSYLDNRTIIVEQGSVGKGTGTYTYGNGVRIRGDVSKSDRKAIGHTHGQIL